MSKKHKIPKDFNYKIYLLLNPDLESNLSEKEAKKHFVYFGVNENRKYKIYLPEDFNYKEYIELNPDLDRNTDKEYAINHYLSYGIFEKRQYKKKESNYLRDIEKFMKIYYVSREDIMNNAKIEFRYFCYRYLNYIRNIDLPEINKNMQYEAVLVEYRCFPHVEFIIRNNINKLGSNWSHTIICGINNYSFMVELCGNINKNIKVIKTEYDNLNQSTYSKFFASLDFWSLIYGEKVLIYQEDSIIFKTNIDDFIKFDYIGAPWPLEQNDNAKGVGNGGFSLRTKKCMIDVINAISIEDTYYSISTKDFMIKNGMTIIPEDVYFSKNMIDFGIGKVADFKTAFNFSTESIYNPNSFGGHNFWICDPNWKNRLYLDIVKQFKPNYDLNMLEHRGGWTNVIYSLNDMDFFNYNANYEFFDMIESKFLWRTDYKCDTYWAGLIHCTPKAPPYLNNLNIKYMFNNPNFINSLDKCIFIVTLSDYVFNYLNKKFLEIDKKIQVLKLTLPVEIKDIIPFDINKYINNDNKKIIQIGQQLRKITSIYQLKLPYKKIWLTGTKKFDYCNFLLNNEKEYLNIKELNLNDVEMKYLNSFDEYDDLLSKNVVFIDLYDASANTVVVECIARKTPLLVTRLDAVIEYLGKDYPLYFDNLNEIESLLTEENIFKAHEHLKNVKYIDIPLFTKTILKYTNWCM